MSRNMVIGKNNKLPWKLSADLKRFRKITSGKPVIMGRKTFESIGRPLPNRINIIITRDSNYKAEGCVIANSAADALKAAKNHDEIMIIGGEQIFKEFLPIANRMYLTLIDEDFEGDAHFPEYDKNKWKEVSREAHEDNSLKYSFVNLEKILPEE